jgi:hypothetical protein
VLRQRDDAAQRVNVVIISRHIEFARGFNCRARGGEVVETFQVSKTWKVFLLRGVQMREGNYFVALTLIPLHI